ncbi:unnamed protein product [Prorocentrum cordatum]|uniref:Anaphase-promoting complex subunit 1 n=1 Tax=Prorocentrum cordatum TaxID=2364126 RepID=A0ABN9QRL9_9DINO|nr:unnamed protein product [Polarella glacialis]
MAASSDDEPADYLGLGAEVVAAALAAAAPPPGPAAAPAALRGPRRRPSFGGSGGRLGAGHAAERSVEAHHAVCAGMRAAKAERRCRAKDDAVRATFDAAQAVCRRPSDLPLVLSSSGALAVKDDDEVCARASASEIVAVAFSRGSRSRVAEVHDRSAGTVDSHRILAAAAIHRANDIWLRRLRERVVEDRPLCVIRSLAWDETTERLALPLCPEACPDVSVKSSWHVLVSCDTMSVIYPNFSAGFAFNRPVIPLASTSASAISAGLFDAPPVRKFTETARSMSDASPPFGNILHFDRDGASANTKLVADHQMHHAARGPSNLSSDMSCGSHRTNLCECAVISGGAPERGHG